MNTEFERAFNSIAAAMSRAVKERSIAIASAEAERNGLIEQVDDKPSCLHVWERSESGNTLRFQWRWYDQSQAFSLRPDMNILSVELRRGDAILQHIEECYEE